MLRTCFPRIKSPKRLHTYCWCTPTQRYASRLGRDDENGLHYTCHYALKAEPSFDTWMRIKPMVKSRRKVTMLNKFFVKNIDGGGTSLRERVSVWYIVHR